MIAYLNNSVKAKTKFREKCAIILGLLAFKCKEYGKLFIL